jgi:hypothetical protein
MGSQQVQTFVIIIFFWTQYVIFSYLNIWIKLMQMMWDLCLKVVLEYLWNICEPEPNSGVLVKYLWTWTKSKLCSIQFTRT